MTAPHPQAIAYITEDEGSYYGCYGTQVVSGATVADVKSPCSPYWMPPNETRICHPRGLRHLALPC
jgi:hypothetical protein